MSKKIYLFTMLTFCAVLLQSCSDIDDGIYDIVGIYNSNVVGIAGPFDLSVSADGKDDVVIEAPFDGEYWSVVTADIDNSNDTVKDIDIREQFLGSGVQIWGTGFYTNGTIQLDYTMSFGGELYDFRIVGSK